MYFWEGQLIIMTTSVTLARTEINPRRPLDGL
jgi:hypothetical protein